LGHTRARLVGELAFSHIHIRKLKGQVEDPADWRLGLFLERVPGSFVAVHFALLILRHFARTCRHFIEAQDWKMAVNMYRAHDMWDDAIRVAKSHGGVNASKQVRL
jgi:hypothetical protein